jgi:hypothetical protein
MIGIVDKVHMVFENEHLMQRDKKDFDIYWTLLQVDGTAV